MRVTNQLASVLIYMAALYIQTGYTDSSEESDEGNRKSSYCKKIRRRCPPNLPSGKVCGSNGKTYKNTCILQRANCKSAIIISVASSGPCKLPAGSFISPPIGNGPFMAQDLIMHDQHIQHTSAQHIEQTSAQAGGMSKQCQRVIRKCPKKLLAKGECCGTDDVSYPNECELHRSRCRRRLSMRQLRVAHPGPCQIYVPTQPPATRALSPPSPCERHCPSVGSDFVCGSDGVTYLSACHLEKIACQTGQSVYVIHPGLCRPPLKPEVTRAPHAPSLPKHEKTTVILPTEGPATDAAPTVPIVPATNAPTTTSMITKLAALTTIRSAVDVPTATETPKCIIDGVDPRVQCDDGTVVTDTPQCPTSCDVTIDTKPVCGSDGKTYKTACHLHMEACLARDVNLGIAYVGECVEDTGPAIDCDFCPDTIYAPVCGTDGISYYNDCELRKYACYISDETLQVAHGGVCRELPPAPPVSPDCPNRCPLLIDPVCGTNGKTYKSICLLKSAACELNDQTLTVAYIGQCMIPTTPVTVSPTTLAKIPSTLDPCLLDCPTNYSPVCGSDWTTYLNECFFTIASCRDPNLQMIHPGTCRMTIRSRAQL